MEAPSVEAVHQTFKDSVKVVGVAWSGDEGSYSAFIDRHSLTFPSIDDTGALVYGRYNVPYQPAWVFISRSGEARTVRGALDETSLTATLEGLAAG